MNGVALVNVSLARGGVKNPDGGDSGVLVELHLARHLVWRVTGRQHLHNQPGNKPEDAVRVDISDLIRCHKGDIRGPHRPGRKLEKRFCRGLTQSSTGDEFAQRYIKLVPDSVVPQIVRRHVDQLSLVKLVTAHFGFGQALELLDSQKGPGRHWKYSITRGAGLD